ncbi:hypothetical protein [Streptomyces sp. NPDC002490]|uniref:hypothetical protein n=1 Tax=Streptomyces sp. NPDC002490 TaxID=3154416 RepID=UPI00331A113E
MTDRTPTGPGPGIDQLRATLDSLGTRPGALSRPRVRELIGAAVPLVWGELKAAGAWDKLIPTDRAALYWTLAVSHHLHLDLSPIADDEDRAVGELVRDCAYFAVHCEPRRVHRWPEAEGRREQREAALHQLAWLHDLHPTWRAEVFHTLHTVPRPTPEPDRTAAATDSAPHPATGPGRPDWVEPSCVWDALADAQRRAVHEAPPPPDRPEGWLGRDAARRFAALPEGWQAEALRRIGRGDPARRTVSEATEAMNTLPRFGIALRPAPPP